MKHWIVPVAGGGIVAALLAVGVFAAVQDGPKRATAQSPTTVPPPATAAPVSGLARTVTVDGIGVVSGAPDTVTVSLGVQVEAGSATEALDDANTKAQALIDTLTGAGVAKSDIQTGCISVYPRYRDSSQDVNGYWASNSVSAVIHDVASAGTVIDAATRAVGDGITLGGVSFSIDDTSGLYAQARQIAVDEARRRAGQLATAAGVSVGAVMSMNESAQEVPSPVAYRDSAASVAVGAPSVPIEPGHQELQLSVQVVFELTA